MGASVLFNSVSPWWLPLCLLIGLAYAFTLYSFDQGLITLTRCSLFALRTLLASFTALLILGPLWRTVNLHVEKPVIVIAQDRSESVKLNRKADQNEDAYEQSMHELVSKLSDLYEVKTYSFGSGFQEGLHFDYTDQATDFSGLLKEIENRYENRNLGAVILASDGIYNRGLNPAYSLNKSNAPFYTVALGDTIPKRDLFIEDIEFNDLVYQGDRFLVNVQVRANGLKDAKTILRLSSQGKQIFSKDLLVSSADFSLKVPISTLAEKSGYQKYEVTLEPVAGELTQANNHRTFYVEVIRGKQKILVLYAAPHPDVSALKQGLETFKNDEVVLKSISGASQLNPKIYDLIILDQLPSADPSSFALVHQLVQSTIPVWYILGSQTDYQKFNLLQHDVSINNSISVTEELQPELNPNFLSFLISDSLKKTIPEFPPLNGPAAGYNLKNPADIFLSQTKAENGLGKPILFSSQTGAKAAYLMGDGLWRWRLSDFARNGNHHASDELIGKMVQYLTAKNDKRKFRVSMPRRIFSEDESPDFNAELFNDSYERITSPDILLEVKNQAGKVYRFAFTKSDNSYALQTGLLPAGEYTYYASVLSKKEKLEASGAFSVKPLQLETFNTTADHHTLYQLSSRTGGKMISPPQIATLPDLLSKNELVKNVSHEERSLHEWIYFRWIALLLILMLSIEWAVRKWNGIY